MHKKFVKPTIALILLWMISGCTATSDEAVDPAKPVEAAEAIEVVEAVEVVEADKSGDCLVKPPKGPVACTMQYDPVCGCDGKTYSNGCTAGAAGVPRSTPGACNGNLNN